jgi:hypothetical protein
MNEQIDDGGPAFPHSSQPLDAQGNPMCGEHSEWGMTLRDYFAAAALTGICAHATAIKQGMEQTGDEAPQFAADSAYEVADAMLAARKEKP